MPDEQDRSEALDDSELPDEYPPHEAYALDSRGEPLPEDAPPPDDEELQLLDVEDEDDLEGDLAEPDTTGPLDPPPDRVPAAAEEAAMHVIEE